MKSKTKTKSKTSLSQKLKKAVSTIHVDVFGYKKTVTRNIHIYLERIASETKLAKEQVIVRIFKDYGQIRIGIHKEGKRIKEIPVSELVVLFTNTDPSGLPQLEQKAAKGIQSFMENYCATHNVPLDNLHICILTSGESVLVKGFDRTQEISTIPLLTLIKHFTL